MRETGRRSVEAFVETWLVQRFADGDGPNWGGMRIFQNSGINVLFNVTSGTPYTPISIINEVTLAAIPNTTPLAVEDFLARPTQRSSRIEWVDGESIAWPDE